jgi:hypothetical protein
MAFTKFASFEVSQTLEVKGAAERQKTASLDKLADYHDYRTDDGYMYARIIAISSRVNKNNDGWPSKELAGPAWDEVESRRQSNHGTIVLEANPEHKTGYSTFVGKPIFVDHNNSDTKRARGVIADSKLRVLDGKTSALDPYYSSDDVDEEHLPPTQVELLLEIDAKSFPKLAQAIVDGSKDSKQGIDGFSMGCDVAESRCSHCGNRASSPREYCSHIKMKGAEHKVTSGKHAGKSRKSYENCYGVKFFEISAVFDPADETALLQELVHEGKTAAELPPQLNSGQVDPAQVLQLAQQIAEQHGGRPVDFLELAETKLLQETGKTLMNDPGLPHQIIPRGGEGPVPEQYRRRPHFLPNGDVPIPAGFPANQGSYLQRRTAALKQADNPLPQFMHTKSPEKVDTLREEKICPVCGEQMEGEKCATCGHVEAPQGFNNPDLQAAQQADLGQPDFPGVGQDEAPNSEQDAILDGAPQPGGTDAVSYLQSRKKGISPGVTSAATVTAGKIKTVERPIKPTQAPATDEPNEAVVSDQDRPVTSTFRTAMDLIRAAKSNQGTQNMSDENKIAAEAPSGVGAQKRVDVEGVGGVIDATNEKASQPDGPHSYENAGKTVDVTGKGGVIEDSNAEASKPSDGSENLPTAGRDSDDAGFNKDKNTDDSGPTKTFDNSNEPESAVTDKVFAHEHDAAKQGVKPIGGSDVQPQRRENVEQESGFTNPQDGTDQWTGTGGNGVTRQQDPVTKKVDPNIDAGKKAAFSHVVAAMKLADAEVELGLLDKELKYDRVAELEALSEEALAAEERVISRVKTAGLTRKVATRREAATREGEVSGRLPSFSKKAGELEPKQATPVDDALADASLFLR